MRSLLLSTVLLAALCAAALTPQRATAQQQGQANVYQNYPYYQGYSNYTPSYYYTPRTMGPIYTTPSVPNYGYYGYTAPASPYAVYMVGPAPVYSGPRYYQGYAPSRYMVYP